MGYVRAILTFFAFMFLLHAEMHDTLRAAGLFALGFWSAWAMIAAPRLSAIMRRIGEFIEEAS